MFEKVLQVVATVEAIQNGLTFDKHSTLAEHSVNACRNER